MNEKWSKILETNKEDKILEYLKKEFDKNDIKYKIDLEEEWKGSIRTPKYIGKFIIYVQVGFESKVKEILNQYYEDNLVLSKNVEDIEESEDDIESQKISRRQTIMIKILYGIVICMVISLIIAAVINS